ncbi:major facilitator superfamily transporter [Aureobasidium subglaciale]|nr:major facilitator superfamily transporter [Aureobasidium subglaciale]
MQHEQEYQKEADMQIAASGESSIDEADTPKEIGPSMGDVFIQGVALFSDGYNVQIIAYMNLIMAKLYPHALTASIKTRLSNSILVGEVIGMLFFGWAIDKLGRRVGIVLTTFALVFGIILATASHGTSVDGMLWMMIIGRGIAGLGAGGEYAVCTTQALECADSSTRLRGRRGLLTAVSTNLAIVTGFFGSCAVSLIVVAAYDNKPNEAIWRICFGIGIFLPLLIFAFRIRQIDSPQYRKHAIKRDIPYRLALKMYWRPLLGCCLAWFLYDFIIYPFNLLAPTLVDGFSKNQTLVQKIGYSGLVNAFAIPGSFFGAFLLDRLGRKETYALGWAIVTVFGFAIGGSMIHLQHIFPLFVVLYGVFQSFLSVGPGNCNFLVSSESFPTPLRGHFLGFAAAVGKAGAAIGTTALSALLASYEDVTKGQQVVFLVGSAISLVGTLVVWFMIPSYNKELETEDARFRAFLQENGHDTDKMGL